MLELPEVTLICLTNRDFAAHHDAMEKSSKDIRWGGKKIIWDDSMRSIDDWNYKVIYELWRYIDTPYAMLIHADGYVINADKWNPDWLNYDYIGAPWPMPQDDYSYLDDTGKLVRVGNSVSLRSRKIMALPTMMGIPWRSYYGNTNEDGFLCCHNRSMLESNGIVFAPLEVAVHFSKEHEIPENVGLETFAFHSL